MNVNVRLKRGTTSQWAAVNPILADGEPGFDTTSRIFKIGDGVTHWTSLSAQTVSADQVATVVAAAAAADAAADAADAAVAAVNRGGANGVAPLDADSKVPLANLPASQGVTRASGTTTTPASLPSINVKDYNAKGDNVTDDTAAVQAALDASTTAVAFSANRPWVEFPPGAYRLASGLTSTKPMMRGQFPNSSVRILWDGTAGADVITSTPTSSYQNYGAVQGINFRAGTSKPGRWLKFNNGIDNMFLIRECIFGDFTVAAVEFNDFINCFMTDIRFDNYSGWGIVINESNAVGTKVFTLDRFTMDIGLTGAGDPAVSGGLLKSTGNGTARRRGRHRISNGRIEVNGPLSGDTAMVLVDDLSAARDGAFEFDNVTFEGATNDTGGTFAGIKYAKTGSGSNYGPMVSFENCRFAGFTWKYLDNYVANSIPTSAGVSHLHTSPSDTDVRLPRKLILQGLETSGQFPSITLRRTTSTAGAGTDAYLESAGTSVGLWSVPDILTPATVLRGFAMQVSTACFRFGTDTTKAPTTERMVVDGQYASEQSSSTNYAFKARTIAATTDQFAVRTDGRLEIGSGTAARDVFLYRDGAGVLRTNGSFVADGGVSGAAGGGIAPSLPAAGKASVVGSTFGTGTFTANQMYFVPFYFPSAQTISTMAVELTVVGDAGSTIRLAVYGDTGANYPGTLISDAGTVAGDGATGLKTLTGLSIAVNGLCWIAAACQFTTTSPTLRSVTAIPFQIAMNGIPSGSSAVTVGYTKTGVTGAAPASLTAAASTAATAPRVGFTLA